MSGGFDPKAWEAQRARSRANILARFPKLAGFEDGADKRADSGCRRGCDPGECYCGEPTFAEATGMCTGCGGVDECLCDEWRYE